MRSCTEQAWSRYQGLRKPSFPYHAEDVLINSGSGGDELNTFLMCCASVACVFFSGEEAKGMFSKFQSLLFAVQYFRCDDVEARAPR